MCKIFATRLRECRTVIGKTQEEVARLLEVKRATYGEYERGKIIPPIDKIEQLAKILETNPQYLLGWEDLEEKAKIDVESLNVYALATKLMNGEKIDSNSFDIGLRVMRRLKMWSDIIDGTLLTDDEFEELLHYLRFIVYKRK